MRIGFDAYTIKGRGLPYEAILEFARKRRIEGVQFLDPTSIVPDLDPTRLAEARATAENLGVVLEIGIPSPNPARRSREKAEEVSSTEVVRDLTRHIEAASLLGCRHVRAYLGDRHDRFRADMHWEAQIDESRGVLRRLEPLLRDLGVAVALETHADATAIELERLLDEFAPEVLGITLDTGNLPMRLDDPIATTERLASRVLATHVKDAVLAFTPRGLCWQARPVGSGILPMPDLLAILHRANPGLLLSIELHPRTYDLPIYDPSWLSHFPDLTPESLAAIVRLAASCERRYAEGSLARPEIVEAIPWHDRDLDWLASSLGYLRAIVSMLGRVDDLARSAH
ncbi:sugar phosphate isomerase/epimerase family protein [Tundrisphaera lichenicola]|uniref:sugar phosphate isomerase/epimerase family protein n=1 Tax=Tundrisphaera lichenicola TaxID=2029860 RepID=UPI003EC154D8